MSAVIVLAAMLVVAPTSPAAAASAIVSQVSAGGYFSCALLDTGQVTCWGYNANGQLGTGDLDAWPRPGIPVVLPVGSSATAISAGAGHVCALLTTGEVTCWGSNGHGQLGNPYQVDRSLPSDPIALPDGATATAISSGSDHTCALLITGMVTCWGYNYYGQLGTGDNGDRFAPSDPIALPGGATATAVSAGGEHTCALLDTGQVTCWGHNVNGQLGTGDNADSWLPPDIAIMLPTGTTATAISTGRYHSCALLNTGRITCWGNSFYGQLGTGDTSDRFAPGDPIALPGGATATAMAISTGLDRSCALLFTGEVSCWGSNGEGQLGTGSVGGSLGIPSAPIALPDGESARAVSTGFDHSCALLSTGQVSCWGSNGEGQLGTGSVGGRSGTPSAPLYISTDDLAPTIATHTDLSQVAAPNTANAIVTYTNPAATDDRPRVTVACLPVSGSAFTVGTTQVNCTATDRIGQTAASAFNVIVVVNPDANPSIGTHAPVNVAIPLNATSTIVRFTTPTATDDHSLPTVECLPASRSSFAVGVTTVTCTATDSINQNSRTTFDVTVTASQSSTVSGFVFQDYNSNGSQDTVSPDSASVDPGIGSVVVRAFDRDGHLVGQTQTDADGSYTLSITGAATPDVRVDFVAPSGMQPSFIGAGAGGETQFVRIGDQEVNTGFNVPGDYCQNNRKLVTCTQWRGDQTWPITNIIPLNLGLPISDRTGGDQGAVWGIGARSDGNVFLGTYVKRHTRYGSAGATNTIYRKNTVSGATEAFVTLPGTLPAHDPSNSYQYDFEIGPRVGLEGLGDVDVSGDGSKLLAVNMSDNRLYVIDLIGRGATVTAGPVTSFPIPDPGCVSGNWHPMGLGKRRGTIYVGGTCGGEATVSATSRYGDPSKVTGHVLAFNGTTFSSVFSFPLNYPRGCAWVSPLDATQCAPTDAAGQPVAADWQAWNTTPPTIGPLDFASAPQPMLSNIEFDIDGTMIIGLHDRFGDQSSGYGTPQYGTGLRQVGLAPGDILRACVTSAGYQLESNAICGDTIGNGSTHPGEGPGVPGAEFYNDNWQNGPFFHNETTQGGLAQVPGGPLYTTAMDPTTANTQGVIGFDNTGAHTSSFVVQNSNVAGTFGKGNGLADLEVLCDQAPVQIGDRVWNDLNNNGTQDPGEPPLPGVTIHLYDDTGETILDTAVTDTNGKYSFATSTGLGLGGLGLGGLRSAPIGSFGLTVDQASILRIDNVDDYTTGPLAGLHLAPANATPASVGNVSDSIDSDAVLAGGSNYGVDQFPEINVPAIDPGMNNQRLDFGFSAITPPPPPTTTTTASTTTTSVSTVSVTTAPPLSTATTTPTTATTTAASPSFVGGTAFVDTNLNGVLDKNEPRLVGIVVTLADIPTTSPTRRPLVQAETNGAAITDVKGFYRIGDLPAGPATIELVAGGRVVRTRQIVVRNQENEDFAFTVQEAGVLSRSLKLPQTGSHTTIVLSAGVAFLASGLALTRSRRKPYRPS